MNAQIYIIAAFSLVAAGCGGGEEVRVEGRLTQGGEPLAGDGRRSVGLTFYKLDGQAAGEPYVAELAPDGRFRVPGPEGRGIPRGKYRVGLLMKRRRSALAAPAAGKPPEDREEDLLGDAFGPGTSPLVREVDGRADLAIDVDRAKIPAPGKSNARAADAARKKAAQGDGLDHG